MPVDRQWTVPEDQGPEIGFAEDGSLLIQPRVVADSDTDALTEAVFEAVAILRRVGGTIQIGSQRVEIAEKVFVTESYIFAYNSFTPLAKRLYEEQPEDDDGLTDDEREQHFPAADDQPQSALDRVFEEARAETPADADELDTAGTVVE